jgi:hypothetical protein
VPVEASWEQLSKLSKKVPGEIWQLGFIGSAMKAMALSLHFLKLFSASGGPKTFSQKGKNHPSSQSSLRT